MAIVAKSRDDNSSNIVASYRDSYGGQPQESLGKTGSGTTEDPYKLSGEVNVPEEKGLGISPMGEMVAGGAVGGAIGKLLGYGVRGAKTLASANTVKGGEKLLAKTGKLSKAKDRAVIEKDSYAEQLLGTQLDKTVKAASSGPVPFSIGALTSIPVIGPKIGKLVQQVGVAPVDKLLSPIWSSSALRNSRRITDNLIKQGFTEKEATLLIQLGNRQAGKSYNKTGTAIGALLGSQKDD